MKRFKMISVILLIGSMVFLGLYAFSYFKVQHINRDYAPIGDFVSVENIDLHYVRGGSGQPVILLHGRDGALQEYTYSFFDQLAEKHDVIAFDRPGYGHSEWPANKTLSLKTQTRLINKALEKLQIENPVLVGHSYGGAVVLQYLADYRDKVSGAVLLAPVSHMDNPPDGALFLFPKIPVLGPILTHTLLVPFGKTFAAQIYEQAFYPHTPNEDYVDTMTALYLRPSNFTATAGELSVMHQSVRALTPHYKSISTPVTIIFGTEDQMLDWKNDGQRLADALLNAELIKIEGAGHKLHHTHPQLVIKKIRHAAALFR